MVYRTFEGRCSDFMAIQWEILPIVVFLIKSPRCRVDNLLVLNGCAFVRQWMSRLIIYCNGVNHEKGFYIS